jgi:hypothetical protein
MAIIEVNSRKISFDEKSFLNLKSLIPKLQKQFPIERYNVENFRVNGETIDINSEDPKLIRPMEDSDYIEVSFNSSNHVLINMVQDINELTEKILNKIVICTDFLKNDDIQISILHLTKIIEAVEIFIQAINHTYNKTLSKDELGSHLPVKELQIHLLSVVKAINSAQLKEDYIMLTDLLEYELKDNLTQWKILILPTLKQELQKSI